MDANDSFSERNRLKFDTWGRRRSNSLNISSDEIRHSLGEAETDGRQPTTCGDEVLRSISFRTDPRPIVGRTFMADDLEIKEMIGRGFFGEVYRVVYKPTGESLVLKKLLCLDPRSESTLLKEEAVMKLLDHPNVLKFIGVLYMNKQLHLLTEFISGGSLKSVIEDLAAQFDWPTRLLYARDIAAGMQYLHSKSVIHRDLNSGNILIKTESQTAVVADFGLARFMNRRKARRRRYTVVGNPYWMAPEMLADGKYDERVDVFSYGITLCEIIGKVTADPDVLPRTSDFGVNREKFLNNFCSDELCPVPFYELAFKCSSVKADHRPTFVVICDWLDHLLRLLKPSQDDTNSLDVTVVDGNTSAVSCDRADLISIAAGSEVQLELKKLTEEIVDFIDCRPNSADLSCVSDSSLISESPCRKKLNLIEDLGYESPRLNSVKLMKCRGVLPPIGSCDSGTEVDLQGDVTSPDSASVFPSPSCLS